MEVTADDVRGYLVDAEPVINTSPGYVANGSGRFEGSIAVTDRRVLVVSQENESERAMSIAPEAICSVESRLRTRFTTGGQWYRGLLGLGVLLVALSTLGLLSYASTALSFTLSIIVVTGALGAAYVYRFGVESAALDETVDLMRDRAPRNGSLDQYEWFEPTGEGDVVVTLATVASLALLGLVVFTPRPILAPIVLVLLGSVALIDHASEQKLELDERNESRRRERVVTLGLASGHECHLHVDATRRIDRELSVLVHGHEPEYAALESARDWQAVG